MVVNSLLDQSRLEALKKALSVYSQRHRVVADNIANVESPDYAAREMRFEEYLQGAKRRLRGVRTQPEHLPIGRPRLSEAKGEIVDQETGFDNGVNDVDIDREMTDLAKADLSYRLATRLLSMKYRMLRSAISGRVG